MITNASTSSTPRMHAPIPTHIQINAPSSPCSSPYHVAGPMLFAATIHVITPNTSSTRPITSSRRWHPRFSFIPRSINPKGGVMAAIIGSVRVKILVQVADEEPTQVGSFDITVHFTSVREGERLIAKAEDFKATPALIAGLREAAAEIAAHQ